MSPQSDRGRTAKELHEIEKSMSRWTMWVAVFTGFLVVTSAVGNLFIYLQYYTAATVQLEAREQSRAVVTNSSTLIVMPDNPDKPDAVMVVAPTFQNYGSTRTNSFKATVSLKYFDGGIPNNLDVTKPYLNVESNNVIIAPNGTYQGIPVAMPASDMLKARDDHGQILFWGSADYTDIFEPKKVHHISMCTMLKPQKNSEGKIGVQTIPYRADCNHND
jgi:hypothetical protein